MYWLLVKISIFCVKKKGKWIKTIIGVIIKKYKLGLEGNYTVENMKTALEMVKSGEVGSLRESAKLHGVIFFVTAKRLQLNQIVLTS